ncbi:MAG TPA: hypothetical protein VGO04_10175 [Ensifer sp.]|nr:hypothetical protein [Ensifer sp.]
MLRTLAHKIPRYDYTQLAIKASLVFSLLFVMLMILSGILW